MLWWDIKAKSYSAQWVPQNLHTLIMGGSEDCVNPISLFQKDERFHRKNISIVTLQGSGHFPWLENASAIKELFDKYISNLLQ